MVSASTPRQILRAGCVRSATACGPGAYRAKTRICACFSRSPGSRRFSVPCDTTHTGNCGLHASSLAAVQPATTVICAGCRLDAPCTNSYVQSNAHKSHCTPHATHCCCWRTGLTCRTCMRRTCNSPFSRMKACRRARCKASHATHTAAVRLRPRLLHARQSYLSGNKFQ